MSAYTICYAYLVYCAYRYAEWSMDVDFYAYFYLIK